MSPRVAALLLTSPLLLAGGGETRAADASPVPAAAFQTAPCPGDTDLPGTEGVDHVCGTVAVPLRHADPMSGTVQLGVVRITSPSALTHDRAAVLLGPTVRGTSILGSLPSLGADPFGEDLVLLDIRGTGRSAPVLRCDEVAAAKTAVLTGHTSAGDADGAIAAAYGACATRLRDAGTDPAAFDSLEAAQDIPRVVSAMGYPAFDLITMGDGTRVAQALLRTDVAGLHSVTLDSVLPTAVDPTAERGRSLDTALQGLSGSCADDPDCTARYGDLSTSLLDTVSRLDTTPGAASADGPDGTVPVVVTGEGLLDALTARLQGSANDISHVPAYIAQAAAGDLSAVAADLMADARAPDVADGHAVVRACTEDLGGAGDPDIDGLPDQLAAFARSGASRLAAVCAAMGIGDLGGTSHDTVTSDVPVLTLTGEFDPVTSWDVAERARAGLSASYGLQLPALGRGVLVADACPRAIVASFVADPGVEPDASCIAAMPEFTTGIPVISPGPGDGPVASAAPLESPRPERTPKPAKPPKARPVKVGLVKVADGFENANGVANAGDGRLFISEQEGYVEVLKPNKDGTFRDAGTFLDIRNRVICCGEKGFLGIAFPPDYARTGYFYVTFAGTGHTWNLEERRVSRDDPDRADPRYKRMLIRVYKPLDYHWAGDMHFGPDGYLYVTVGDGGFGGKVKDPGDPEDRAQDLSVLFGKMLRIDPRGGRKEGLRYTVPSDNPFVRTKGAQPEIWAYGLRNPWRWSFDRRTGNLWIGDVGMWRYEEVDRATGTDPGRGLNFGWRRMEGPACYNPKTGCDDGTLTRPFAWYVHADGMCAVTGGYVYRGQRYPALRSWYVFGDYCSGRLLLLDSAARPGRKPKLALDTPASFSALGEDADGELYVLDYGAGNALYRVTGKAR